jgi:hypothetical protein
MRAEPFVQAELRKGDVVAEALDQVQSYSLMRHKAAVEVQMSESLLAAEEEMNNFARRMEDSPEIYNVFKPDGSGLWPDATAEMRDRLADRIESRSAREEFKARFNQREQATRFRLQDQVDRRIQARAAATAAERMKAAEDRLADPYNATVEDYELTVLGIRTEEDAAIRSGTATPETTGVMNAQLARNIANRTTLAYVFDDPARAVALAEALDLQDDVDAGRITAPEAYERSGLEDDAAYTLYTLETLPREQALEIIYDTLGRANRLYSAAQARYESDARALGSRIDTARSVLSSGGVVGPEALEDMMAQAQRLRAARPELLAAVEDLSADYNFISGVRGMNRIELEAELERYTGGMLGVGEAGIDTPEEVYRRDVVARALDATVRAEAAATAEARAAATPALRLIETSAEVLDSVMSSPTPNPLIAEEAMAQLLESYRDLPPEIITEDMRESMAEVQQTMAALESWRENQPAENMAELERLRSAIPSADNLPPGVDLIDQIAINQRQANLLSGFVTAQQNALAGGQGLAYARSQDVLIDNPAFDAPVVVGEPIDLTGDPAAIRASLDQRFREVDFVETRFGTAGQKVLLPQEVALIENILSEGQPGQRAVILGMIADQGADRAERIFRSLDLNNPEMRLYSHIGSLMTSGNERAATLALRGMEVEQPPALTDMEVSRAFRAQVGAAFAYLPYTAEAMRETARFIYAEAASRDPDLAEMIRANGWENSMSLAMGDLKIETINRNPVLMETIVSPDLVEDWLADPTSMPNIVVNDLELGEYSFNVLNQGRWYPVAVGQDQYQLRTGEDVNSAPWTDENGRPVLVSLYRLSTIMSYPEDTSR